MPVSFVGHPLIEKIQPFMNYSQHRNTLNLPLDVTLIALLPGSRKNEIEKHLPILRDTAQLIHRRQNQTHFVIPVADTINSEMVRSSLSIVISLLP